MNGHHLLRQPALWTMLFVLTIGSGFAEGPSRSTGFVDFGDLYAFRGPKGSKTTLQDSNSDGVRDSRDLFLLALHWQGSTPPSAGDAAAMPAGASSVSPILELDMDPATPAIDRLLARSAPAVGQDSTFEVHLVVTGAVNMTGLLVDLSFDSEVLELLNVREVPGDLNFSGDLQRVEEVEAIRSQYEAEQAGEATFADFVDGFGRRSAVVYDSNANQRTDLSEVLAVEREYEAEQTGTATDYWTRAVFDQTPARYNESVEIFDPPVRSNLGGVHPSGVHPGLIDDLTVVLLKRPDRTEPFGFNGDAIVCTLTFRLKPGALQGTYAFGFPQGLWIDNTFTGLDDGVMSLALPDEWPCLFVTSSGPPPATPTPTPVVTPGPQATVTPYPIPASADVNWDGEESVNDLFMFATCWQRCATDEARNPFLFKGANLIPDDTVDQQDLYWLIQFLRESSGQK